MVTPLTEEIEDFAEEISEALTDTQLIHLSDILSGNIKELSHYYGENSIQPSDADRHALRLARSHQQVVQEFLHRARHEWKRSTRTRIHIEDLLVEESVTSDDLEEYDLTYTEYLLVIYHFYYSPSDEAVQNYNRINAKTLLFHNNSGQVFNHSEPLTLQREYLERKCSELSRKLSRTKRNFHADLLHVEPGEEAMVKLYWERNRTPEMIFSDRLPETHPNADTAGVTHRPTYPIKTISLKIVNDEGSAEVSFSESTSSWTKKLREFFSQVFGIDDPFKTLEENRSESVDRILDAVRETVVSEEDGEDDADAESVFEKVTEELDAVREETIEQTREEEDDDVAEVLDEKIESIEPTGIIVKNVEDTLTSELSVKSDSTLEEWMERNTGAREMIENEVASADNGAIGLRFRAHITSEDDFDEFVLEDGRWKTESGRRVPEQTRTTLDRLFGGNDE